jgi:hypothetical protein
MQTRSLHDSDAPLKYSLDPLMQDYKIPDYDSGSGSSSSCQWSESARHDPGMRLFIFHENLPKSSESASDSESRVTPGHESGSRLRAESAAGPRCHRVTARYRHGPSHRDCSGLSGTVTVTVTVRLGLGSARDRDSEFAEAPPHRPRRAAAEPETGPPAGFAGPEGTISDTAVRPVAPGCPTRRN